MNAFSDLAATAKHAPDRLDPEDVRSALLRAQRIETLLLTLRSAENVQIGNAVTEGGYPSRRLRFELDLDEETFRDFLELIYSLGDQW